jgi:hypothetical protein
MTNIYFTDPELLPDMGYNWKDCQATWVCPIEEDGAVNPPCQQATMLQAWECDPVPFVPEEVDHDIRPPYYGPQALVAPVEQTETVAEVQVEEKPVVIERPAQSETFLFGGVFALLVILYGWTR